MIDFARHLEANGHGILRRQVVEILQVNVGWRCDLACHHCHVEAGPNRSEALDRRGAERVLELLERNPSVKVLDLTGGAPELNPQFRFLAAGARALGRRVIDRCNLTVLLLPEQQATARFLAEQGIEVVASLPCYTAENVESQRGRGVFGRSIEALQLLNTLGYGHEGSSLRLDLVYNPLGASLPPSQAELEARYRQELRELFGIEFHHLLTITNMPIRRFERQLHRDGELGPYQALLVNHFNPAAVAGLMCRNTLSVDYRGRLYDCDFNQMLDLETPGAETTLWDVEDLSELAQRPVATGPHCFGCTAGAGSSCGGAIT